MKQSFSVSTTQQCEFVDITARVQEIIGEIKLNDGAVMVFVPHTTSGITINESADPNVRHDILMQLDKLVPESGPYRHGEGNSPAHIKASLIGSSVTVMVSRGRMDLGTWQGIFFCEFDGPRTRKVWIKSIEG